VAVQADHHVVEVDAPRDLHLDQRIAAADEVGAVGKGADLELVRIAVVVVAPVGVTRAVVRVIVF
jgi:hypothetical protein